MLKKHKYVEPTAIIKYIIGSPKVLTTTGQLAAMKKPLHFVSNPSSYSPRLESDPPVQLSLI